ncbi:MAG: class I tRNA ligase family protein [Bacteroidetes bacterium]|nr:class I tRNA ligase family protein [Bacteroidota bacterium]
MIQGVSAFVYGFSTGLTMPFLDNLDVNGMPNAQKYIVPKSSYDNFNKGLKDQLIESIQRNELERQKQLGFNSITLAEKMQSVHPVHVDISLVDPISNELDVQGFKNSERYKSLLIDEIFCEEDGKYICGRESEKMSKSKYNVVNPDDIVRDYSADTLRLYEMFLGPLEQHKPWNTNGITGVHGFLKKLWRLYHSLPGEGQGGVGAFNVSNDAPTKEELKALHKTIKKVVDDIERFSFNTSVSNFMICVNELTDLKCNKKAILEPLAIIIAPYAPHIAEMLWAKLQYGESFDINAIPHGYKSIVNAQFPEFKEEYLVESSFKYPVSINGKTKFFHELDLALSKEDVEKEVLALEQTQKILEGKAPKKIIVVPNKIVNIVV